MTRHEAGDRFAAMLPAWVPAAERDVDPDGDVSFEWYGEGTAYRGLSVSVSDAGHLHYAALLADEDVRCHGKGWLGDGVPADVLDVLRRLYPQPSRRTGDGP